MTLEPNRLNEDTAQFYARSLTLLNQAELPYLVGGAYALAQYTGIERHTKDLDIIIQRDDRDRVLNVLEAAGYRTEVPFPHWLAKVFGDHGFIDVIYNSGNGLSEVDDEWFANVAISELFGVPISLCPVEELIWSKGFVQERERFDGADVIHLIRFLGATLDWRRLLRRFGTHWRVLYGHIVLFGFVYPNERDLVPRWVMNELADRLRAENDAPLPQEAICFGTTLSREQYLTDVTQWGFRDARLKPLGAMSAEEIAHWTAAIGSE